MDVLSGSNVFTLTNQRN